MKKQLLCSFTLLAFLVASVASATPHKAHDKEGNPPDEKTHIVTSFVAWGAITALLHQGTSRVGLPDATHRLLQAANTLYALGYIVDKQAFKDLGSRVLLAGATGAVAAIPAVSQYVGYTPLIGQQLQAAGKHGTAVVAIALYEVAARAYDSLLERTKLGKTLGLTE